MVNKLLVNKFSGFTAFLKTHWRAVLLASLGVVLILFSILPRGHSATAEELTLEKYGEALEERVGAMCSSVEGVGRCKVFITFERGEQSSYKGSTLIEEKPPKVLGVVVACRGADSDSVRADLTEMLCALFGIGANRIAILKLNS